ncbi:hypothetical protein FCL47_17005 [Desulfopila sp. IMCC35006]|uniref:hypothetical protein n=1 Tax=Desulfopila sp. IMCC35006 TaxID=2569542 RepID=UPI0010AC2AD3|nr:hypothetical protein [Desulfopila sp. IMCC35006]TKB24940.1 hypothetical protein FCL47_17005 [Desulfopila sp. IMCC35006]
MSDTINLKTITALAVIVLIMIPEASFSRDNSLKGGLSIGLDNDNRSYDNYSDDYRRIVLTPMMQFTSLSERDSLEMKVNPGIRYDLIDSGTDWDANLNLAAKRFMTKSWQLGITNNFLRSDYQNTETGILSDPANPPQVVAPPSTEPQLSPNRYRTLYWLNTLNLFSENFYRENSSIRLGLGYDVLRNDDSIASGDQDYDRYTASVRNEHRYNPRWRSTLDMQFVRGIYKAIESNVTTGLTGYGQSGDLDEYHLLLGLDNDSIVHNPLSLTYNYIGTVYDETSSNDTDVHQARLTWRRDFSPRMYTRLGAGPSYEKTEGTDANWSSNGIAEVNYSLEHGFVNFLVEKKYDTDNFSGSNENGVVDSWNSSLSGSYQLQKDLTLSGVLAYTYEDRQQPVISQSSGGVPQLEKYHKDIYVAGTVLKYGFWQFYNASIAYTYTKENSEVVGDDYDDHRILLTLSWEKELFHW